jgi:2-dehydropantoate 2-reductase
VLYDRFVVAGATTTVLQDWTKGRRSEVEDINGLIAREGARLGIRTPVNDAIADVGRRIEAGELAPSPGNVRLLAGEDAH